MSFKRLLTRPFSLFNSSSDSEQNQALMYGLPAILLAVGALIVLGLSQFGRAERLESWYAGLLQTAQRNYQRERASLDNLEKLASNQDESAESEDSILTQINEAKAAVDFHKESEQVYLEKLMDLNPEKSDYKYQLAMSYADVDKGKQRALLGALAPDSKAVFHKAHVDLAQDYFRLAEQSKNYAEKKELLKRAEIHADHCLVLDKENNIAMLIKAMVLEQKQNYLESYKIYDKLFEKEPAFFRQLANLSPKLNLDANSAINQAIVRFQNRLDEVKDDETLVWVNCWTNLVDCWRRQEQYDVAVRELQAELSKQTQPVRKKFLNDQLANVYSRWAAIVLSNNEATPEERTQAVENLRLAHQKQPNNPITLETLAQIVVTDEELSARAQQIYDPYKDPDPPASVLSQLGSKALGISDYDQAVELFEKARVKSPNNATVLNNLAYSYLVCEERSPNKALGLVEDGIRLLKGSSSEERYISYLNHTKGTALMQLGRMEEAVASFESALKLRPNNAEIVESLIRCYEGRIDSQSNIYREYLDVVKAKLEKDKLEATN